ncbi:uncharacterized protein L203_105045 [Cryptococcus depauperatus CBS 7841]|uniref:Uncharacterized protein n=1 Tax=Cryptococcus depauperatus CBS 7841 TaxID=1295531 RepID=A0A1E3I1K8_9TREE|nr:U4/U6 small nuclear ribonucleoprotein PRP3 [Cryptococcus depauperatus CBS 7841]
MTTRRLENETVSGQPDSKRLKKDGDPPALDIAAIRAQLAARKTALEAQSGKSNPASSRPASSAPVPQAPPSGLKALPAKPTESGSTADKIAAAKARIEALNARTANPYLSGGNAFPSKPSKAETPAPSSIALHPLLMSDTQQQQAPQEKNEKKALRDRYKTMAPKFTSVRANASLAATQAPVRAAPVAPAPSLNPYTSIPASASPAPDAERVFVRKSKKLQFSRAGKYVEQGDQMRNEQKMEALRQRIAEASRKAGLDSEFDTLERSLKRQPPPAIEWWDEAILPEGMTYEDDLEAACNEISTSSDSLITHLVLHPIPIPAPGDRKQLERGLMLTKKEQKKMRRQRRQAELEDKRDRQKMGLLPPDPPKVRLANMMKVLTSDAVQDPTKVEAKVKKEVAMRAYKHEKDNQERKLTAEQRKEKEYNQMLAKERNGIRGAVFKIKYLTNGRHKFKVRETAKSNLLSGICIFHPSFALIFVEGIEKSIKHYKRLMLERIDWTEQARPLKDGEAVTSGGESKEPEDGDQDLSDNKCELIWEGELTERTFRMFRARHVESDGKAKEWLTPRFEGMWDLAKRWQWAGEDL